MAPGHFGLASYDHPTGHSRLVSAAGEQDERQAAIKNGDHLTI